MCGGCRVEVGGETKFVCVDGPEFDAHQVDWDEVMLRNSRFKVEEDASTTKYEESCKAVKKFQEGN